MEKGPDEIALRNIPTNSYIELDIEETIFVTIELLNTTDLLGNNAQNQVDAFRNAVLSVVNNRYGDDNETYPLYYNGGDFSQLTNNARYFWQMEFKRMRCQIDYDREAGDPNITPLLRIINDINLENADPDTHPNAKSVVNLPQ